jgi:PEP-CTERM motif
MLRILKIVLVSIVFIGCPSLTKGDPLVLASNQLSQTGISGTTLTFSGTITNLGLLPAGPGGELALFNNNGSVVTNFDFLLPFNFSVGPGETTAVIPFFSFTVVANPTLGPFEITYSIRGSNALVFTANIRGVPEPATMLLFGTGLAGVAIKMRKRLNRGKSGQRSQ